MLTPKLLFMKTIEERTENLIEVEKSKFLAIACPITAVEEFEEIIKNLRKEYKKARHVVYAYRIGDKSKSNDDGEPKGTAGRPLLELLHKKDLNYIALFVVRHFGGVKLGASRLLRTYVNAGNEALNKCRVIEICKGQLLTNEKICNFDNTYKI